VLYRLTRELRRIENNAAAADQLTMWQYAVLAVAEDAPANQTALATRLDYSKNRLVHDIDHLESLGLVRREPLPTDRRSNTITITSRGRTTRARIQRRIHAAEDELLHRVPPSARTQFAQLAADITDGLRRGA
jgi:DNA-binding MarR family transcriptional regulator